MRPGRCYFLYAPGCLYGQHAYVIGVTGQGKPVLSKGYVNRIAEGTQTVTGIMYMPANNVIKRSC